MDKEEIIALLRAKSGGAKRSVRKEAIDRLAAALTAPASFEELDWELAPMARYLGPGVWMDAIKGGATRG
jgi:hypothetical protein